MFFFLNSCEKKSIVEKEIETLKITKSEYINIDTTFYKDNKIESLRFISDSTEYLIISFYKSGKKKFYGKIKNNQCHDKYIDWYENGKYKWTREYIFGRQIGKSIEYQPNGKLKQINDNDNNEITEYWKNGNPKYKSKENNYTYYYYSNGNYSEKFDNLGPNESTVEYFNENGNIIFKGEFKKNILFKDKIPYNGKIICYFNDGKISHYEEIINGIINGKFYVYYGNKNLKCEGEYNNGVEVFYKCYHENGKVNFIRDNKNKTFKAWDENGKLII